MAAIFRGKLFGASIIVATAAMCIVSSLVCWRNRSYVGLLSCMVSTCCNFFIHVANIGAFTCRLQYHYLEIIGIITVDSECVCVVC